MNIIEVEGQSLTKKGSTISCNNTKNYEKSSHVRLEETISLILSSKTMDDLKSYHTYLGRQPFNYQILEDCKVWNLVRIVTLIAGKMERLKNGTGTDGGARRARRRQVQYCSARDLRRFVFDGKLESVRINLRRERLSIQSCGRQDLPHEIGFLHRAA